MPRFAPHPDRRVAVVTGASSGLGHATAVALAAAGHPVVLGARRTDRLEATADEIRDRGGEAVARFLDLADSRSIDAFAAGLDTELGPVEVLVSNAGEVVPVTGVEADPDVFAASVHVNLLGAQRLVHHLGPGMVERGRGDIVFVSSDVVRAPRPRMAAYVVAKHGLEGLARAMQMELEGTGVRVGVIRPGPASTEQGTTWSAEVVDQVVSEWSAWGLLRHTGALRPREVADVIVHMIATPRGTHMTLVELQPEAPARHDGSPS